MSQTSTVTFTDAENSGRSAESETRPVYVPGFVSRGMHSVRKMGCAWPAGTRAMPPAGISSSGSGW